MDYNKILDFVHELEEHSWQIKVKDACDDGRLCTWVSTLHPQNLPCRLNGFMNGSYNLCVKVLFQDDTTWVLRLPRPMGVGSQYADEKVAVEIEALSLIREKTSIPVPEVLAWGLSDSNPLGVGPFLVMNFIEGINLHKVFNKSAGAGVGGSSSRLIDEDVPEDDIRFVYRQMADFMIQLWNINFDQIGSLPTSKTGFPIQRCPLTWKANEIMQLGGVNPFGDRSQSFSTTSEYFQYIMSQDFEQMRRQPNSAYDQTSANDRYGSLMIVQSLISEMVHPDFNSGPFKLICDDFGPANMIVRSKDDLTVVGVVDLEWAYAGPAQLFASAPWWLLHDRPINDEWDFDLDSDEPPKVSERYFKMLQIFKDVLAEEEEKIPGQPKELSTLVKWSEDIGAMWLHMLLSCGFFDTSSFPSMNLQLRMGLESWRDRVRAQADTQALKKFTSEKVMEFDHYWKVKTELEEKQNLMTEGKMSRDEFMAAAKAALSEVMNYNSS